jgi:hypothetical protein
MWLIDKLAEQKITEAIEKGELDDLPGRGQPLCLDDDDLVPEDLRVAYRLLKNAGFLPPQFNMRKEIANVELLLAQARSQEERAILNKRLSYLLTQLSLSGSETPLFTEMFYVQKTNG